MTRGCCDKSGSRRKDMRLLFYIAGVLAIIGIAAYGIWMSVSEERGGAVDGGEKIVFVLNNGEADIECGIGDEVPSPRRSGYYLSGWYRDEELTHKIEFNSIAEISGAERIYAEWRELRDMGGVRMADAIFIYDGQTHVGEIEGMPEGASVEYIGEYKEAGEYETMAVVRAYGYRDKVVEGRLRIVKAKADMSGIMFESKAYRWDGKEKSIEIEGELPEGISVEYENNGRAEIGEYEVTARFDGGNNYESIGELRATLKIYAEAYEVTFEEENGEVRVMSVEYGREGSKIPEPEAKRGYRGSWEIESVSGKNVRVKAVYEIERYEIEYELNGGEALEVLVKEYTVNDAIRLAEAEREYYEFAGWYESADCEGERVYEIAAESEGERRYYAKWIEREYVVEYSLNGGQNNAHNVNSGEEYVYTVKSGELELYNPTRYGYRFVCWRRDGEKIEVISAASPCGYTVSAEWEEIRYGIRYELNGGEKEGDSPEWYTIASEETELGSARREGYKFEGWYLNGEYEGERIERIRGDRCEDVILYAKWSNAVYVVERIEGRVIITEYDYSYGEEVVIPAYVDGEKIEGIGSGVLRGARSVEIEAGIESIGEEVFRGCRELERLVLPESLNSLPGGLLGDCERIRELTVPYAADRRIEGEGEYGPLCEVFGRSEREGYYGVEVRMAKICKEGITAISLGYKCYVPESLREVTVLGGDIMPNALSGLRSVREIRIVGGERINAMAMAGCEELERVQLPEGMKEIRKSALEGCPNIKELYIHERTDETILSELLSKLEKEGRTVKCVRYTDVEAIPDETKKMT